jgi:hypothetical protein
VAGASDGLIAIVKGLNDLRAGVHQQQCQDGSVE